MSVTFPEVIAMDPPTAIVIKTTIPRWIKILMVFLAAFGILVAAVLINEHFYQERINAIPSLTYATIVDPHPQDGVVLTKLGGGQWIANGPRDAVPFLSIEGDRAKAKELLEHYKSLGYSEFKTTTFRDTNTWIGKRARNAGILIIADGVRINVLESHVRELQYWAKGIGLGSGNR